MEMLAITWASSDLLATTKISISQKYKPIWAIQTTKATTIMLITLKSLQFAQLKTKETIKMPIIILTICNMGQLPQSIQASTTVPIPLPKI